MNWDDLRFFLALARAGTLSEAAHHLGVSHTTVSRRVAAFSQAGAPLFVKTPDGFQLTAAGESLHAIAESMESQAAAAERLVTGGDARLAGRLVVTTIDMLVEPFAPLVARFAATYPEVELIVSVDNRAVSITRREADVALRLSNDPPPHLVGRRLRRYEWAPYATPDLKAAHGDDLSRYPWLGWVEPHASLTERWISQYADRRVVRVDTGRTMLDLMAQGLGASLLASGVAEGSGLVPIGDIIPGFGMDLWLLTHPDLRHAARVRAFIDMCVAFVADSAATA